MTFENAFQIRRGVLQFHRPPDSGDLLFLCWPVLVYRVTAPVLRVRHLNIIEKVVLALCNAGLRDPAVLAAKIYQSAELCEHVLRQLRDGGRIDQYGVPTEEGRRTLATNRVGEEPDLIVTHVFQDPMTRRLLPRAAQDLVFQRVHAVQGGQAGLRLDTAGAPRPITAHILPPGSAEPRRPDSQEVIDAVAAQRQAELARRAEQFRRAGHGPTAQAVERDLQELATELTLPHETAVHRVLDIGRPAHEYLLVWLDGDRLRDPFGLDPNPMLQRLLGERIRTDPALAEAVSGAADASAARVAEEHRTTGDAVKRVAETRLVRLLGDELRRRPDALKLLLEMEERAALGGEAGMEAVARESFRLYEYLFRRMVIEYPPPDRPSWAVGSQTPPQQTVLSALKTAARDIGLDNPPENYFDGQYIGKVRTYPERVSKGHRAVNADRGYVNDLFLYVLVAAADPHSPHRSGHPMRALVRDRPTVLTDLNELRQLRNRGSHATRDATVEEDIEWCRGLALAAARLLVSMPQPPVERN